MLVPLPATLGTVEGACPTWLMAVTMFRHLREQKESMPIREHNYWSTTTTMRGLTRVSASRRGQRCDHRSWFHRALGGEDTGEARGQGCCSRG